MKDHPHIDGTLKTYGLGFTLSVALTLAAYFVVVKNLFSGTALTVILIGLGIAQALVQLILFLHLGDEPRPKWNFIVFLFMIMVLLIVFFGTLWIMYQLNYRVMPPMDMR